MAFIYAVFFEKDNEILFMNTLITQTQKHTSHYHNMI